MTEAVGTETKNDRFLEVLATLPELPKIYGCGVEVASEQVDPFCKTNCGRRVFFYKADLRGRILLFSDTFQPVSGTWSMKEYRYLRDYTRVIGMERFSGIVRTGANGEVLQFRFRIGSGGSERRLFCRGVNQRRTGITGR